MATETRPEFGTTLEQLDSFSPVFIVGNSRSGTTLVSRILNNSSTIFTFEELHFFEEIWNPKADVQDFSEAEGRRLVSKLLNIQRNGYLSQQKSQDYEAEAQTIIDATQQKNPTPRLLFAAFLRYESQRHQKSRPCEQTPLNVLYLNEILTLYPQARIINMIRDPRDILLSQKRRWKRPFLSSNIPKVQALRYWVNYHPFTISKLWNTNVAAANRFKDDPRVKIVQFEQLVANPAAEVRKICEFLNITYRDTLLDVPQVGSSNESDQPNRKGIDQKKVDGWRNGGLSSAELFICQKVNWALMNDYGYSVESLTPNPITLMLSILFFPIKIALALSLNLKRVRNLRESIARRLG